MKIKCTEYYQKKASLEIVKQSTSKYLCIHCITFVQTKSIQLEKQMISKKTLHQTKQTMIALCNSPMISKNLFFAVFFFFKLPKNYLFAYILWTPYQIDKTLQLPGVNMQDRTAEAQVEFLASEREHSTSQKCC